MPVTSPTNNLPNTARPGQFPKRIKCDTSGRFPNPMVPRMAPTRSLLCLLAALSGQLVGVASAAEPIQSLDWRGATGQLIITQSHEINLFDPKTGTAQSLTLPDIDSEISDATLWGEQQNLLISTRADGLFSTALAAPNWQSLNQGLDTQNLDFVFTNVAVTDILYAANQTSVYKYTPEDQWLNMDGGPGGVVTDYLHSDMPDSMDTGWIFATGQAGIAFTADCFCFWRDVKDMSDGFLALAYQPEEPSWYYAATATTLFQTQDGARTWQAIATLPDVQTTALVSGPMGTLYLGTASGQLWSFTLANNSWVQLDE
jgi:hypothetical protein